MTQETNLGSKPRRILGFDEATIDDKGRVLLTKKKREWLGEDFVMRLGDHGCIYFHTAEQWEQISDHVLSFDPTNVGRVVYSRLVLGTAEDGLNYDQQGRVVVPRRLRELAKLAKEVVLLGCGDRIELWAVEEWTKYELSPDSYALERVNSIRNAQAEMKQI